MGVYKFENWAGGTQPHPTTGNPVSISWAQIFGNKNSPYTPVTEGTAFYLRNWLLGLPFVIEVSQITRIVAQTVASASWTISNVTTTFGINLRFTLTCGEGYTPPFVSLRVETTNVLPTNIVTDYQAPISEVVSNGIYSVSTIFEFVTAENDSLLYWLGFMGAEEKKHNMLVSTRYFIKPCFVFPVVANLTTDSLCQGNLQNITLPNGQIVVLQQDKFYFVENITTTVLLQGFALTSNGNVLVCQFDKVIYINNSYDSIGTAIISGAIVLLNGQRYRAIGPGILLPYY